MLKKKIATPLTEKELKEAVKTAKIVMPKHSEMPEAPKKKKSEVTEGDFNHITIASLGYRQDQIGIDGNGKEHIFHGGPWVNFNWSVPGFGFGELSIALENGKIVIDSETLGKDFVKAFLCDMVDKAEVK